MMSSILCCVFLFDLSVIVVDYLIDECGDDQEKCGLVMLFFLSLAVIMVKIVNFVLGIIIDLAI